MVFGASARFLTVAQITYINQQKKLNAITPDECLGKATACMCML